MIRREFLSIIIALLGLPTLFYSLRRRSPDAIASVGLQPRYRTRGKSRYEPVKLPGGTYLNPASNVVHFVDAQRRLKGAFGPKRPDLALFRPFDMRNVGEPQAPTKRRYEARPSQASGPAKAGAAPPPESRKPNPFGPRPPLDSRSSVEFEAAAIGQLRLHDPDGACDLLIRAIQYDAICAAKRDGRAGIRLFDLLAAIGARYGRDEYVRRASLLLKARFAGTVPDGVQHRLDKWANPNSKWYTRWRTGQAKWGGLLM